MLKIRDDVDLKKLEKFGFDNNPDCDYLRYYNDDNYMWVKKTTRQIDYRYFWGGRLLSSIEPDTHILKIITNKLIKAGLVEKEVEE